MTKRLMEERFGYINEEGEFEFPQDFGMCYYCGFVGLDWVQKICPKCKKLSVLTKMIEKNRKEFINQIRTDWADKNIRKQISEIFVANKYRSENYKVIQTARYDIFFDKHIPNEEGILKLLEDYNGKDKFILLIKKLWSGLPDLIRFKDNKISFVEVKSNNSSVSPKQEKTIKTLEKAGFEIIIERVSLNYVVNNSEVKIPMDLKEFTSYDGESYFK